MPLPDSTATLPMNCQQHKVVHTAVESHPNNLLGEVFAHFMPAINAQDNGTPFSAYCFPSNTATYDIFLITPNIALVQGVLEIS